MSRVAVGWIAAPVAAHEAGCISEADSSEGSDGAQLAPLLEAPAGIPVPLDIQGAADQKARSWAMEWGAGMQLPEVSWPVDLGPAPPPLSMTALRDALIAFPAGTGLGWDDLHPRALLRLPNDTLEALLRLLLACESQGRWSWMGRFASAGPSPSSQRYSRSIATVAARM